MAYFLFFLLAIVTVAAVLGMIFSKNQAHNALYIILAFVCIAGLFALLDAPFIAVIQIIIYAGAIMVLFIFVIMMINLKEGVPPERKKGTIFLAFIIGVVLVIELIFAFQGALSPAPMAASEELANPSNLGQLLFTEYLYPFEITSVLIIAALVGAIVLVKKKDNE
ncbi:MAG: NADH-quinone oxidoreductase subunit J [Candidatus Aminicenantes bacterium]|nr:NADH-quinone oxidoreductase subunit J [Candidatus Aminicenantes bacterium]